MSRAAPLLIGLTGPAGAGKDSAADALHHLAGFRKMAFADALRAEVCAAFGVPLYYLTERDTKEHPISALALAHCHDLGFVHTMHELGHADDHCPRSPRWVLQQWGTEYRRRLSADYWIDRARRRVSELEMRRLSVVITDVRFANEAAMVRARGGQVWQVRRPGLDAVEGTHASAVSGAEFAPERVIENDGDLDDLRLAVMQALEAAREGAAA